MIKTLFYVVRKRLVPIRDIFLFQEIYELLDLGVVKWIVDFHMKTFFTVVAFIHKVLHRGFRGIA